MRRKYELGSDYRLVCSWKEKIKMRNVKDWEEEVSSKSTLKWYKLTKNGAGVARYLKSVQGQEVVTLVRLLFRLRTGLAYLLEVKKGCKIIINGRCVMCESGAGDVEHLLVTCGKFERDRWVLADDVRRIVGAGEWLEEYGRVGKESKVALLLGKCVERVSDTVMEEVSECVMYWIGKW